MSNVNEAIHAAAQQMRRKNGLPTEFEISDDFKKKLKESGVANLYVSGSNEKVQNAIDAVYKVITERPSLLEEIKIYRKYVPVLLEEIWSMSECIQTFGTRLERYNTDSEDKKYKKWTKEEDEFLIEMICDSRCSMLELSTTMGRTVPAIKTRVSKLVGLKRISQEVAGKFIGTINGNHAECVLDGTLYKEVKK